MYTLLIAAAAAALLLHRKNKNISGIGKVATYNPAVQFFYNGI